LNHVKARLPAGEEDIPQSVIVEPVPIN